MEEDTINQRVNCFCYYFLHTFEEKIFMYLSMLEETAIKTNSNPGTLVGSAFGAVPKIGNALKAIANEVDKLILSKLLKKDSRKLASFVYSYKDNRNKVREMLLECGVKIFMAFEEQMSKVSAEGGLHRAMQKIAVDSVNRYIMFNLGHPELDISIDTITKGVLIGTSISNNYGMTNPGRTLLVDGKSWKSSKVFSKVGLCVEENDSFVYYKNENTSPKKYGYRLLFPHEDVDVTKKLWTVETDVKNPYQYQLKSEEFAAIFKSSFEYYLHQCPQLEFRYKMEKALSEACNDRQHKLDILLQNHQDNHEISIEHINQLKYSTIEAINLSKYELGKMVKRCYNNNTQRTIETAMKLIQNLNKSKTTFGKEDLSQLIMDVVNTSTKNDKELKNMITELKNKIDAIYQNEFSESKFHNTLKEENSKFESIIQNTLEKLVDKKIKELCIPEEKNTNNTCKDGLKIIGNKSSNNKLEEINLKPTINIGRHTKKSYKAETKIQMLDVDRSREKLEESLTVNHDSKATFSPCSDIDIPELPEKFWYNNLVVMELPMDLNFS